MVSLLSLENKVIQIELPQVIEVEVIDAPDAGPRRHRHLGHQAGHHRDRRPGARARHITRGTRSRSRTEDGEFAGGRRKPGNAAKPQCGATLRVAQVIAESGHWFQAAMQTTPVWRIRATPWEAFQKERRGASYHNVTA